ncbi:hypothetical protein K458DRAFT_317008 [Lentithecium fluviatile CBS 122367]|uniref:Uncharacterized protein n=1 Tax=Lentithecium fluviatile CBS 122367 TaxID=1168545 RepID=A0A6G1IKD6_9PLEO|nr:hypothetical protein K458DRAFT_317008 [Lentithecium fluviatile CBS 122367]
MQPSIPTTLIAFIGLATALPLDARAPGDVTFCTGENYTGECTTLSVPFYECQKVPAEFAGNVGSFKVDAGAYCRITYTADTCTPHGDAFIWPDTNAPTLHHYVDVQGNVVDAGASLTSFLCQVCTACEA